MASALLRSRGGAAPAADPRRDRRAGRVARDRGRRRDAHRRLRRPRLLLEKRFAFAQVAVVDAVAAIASVGVGIAAARRGWGAWSLVIGGTQPAVAYFLVQSLAFVALCRAASAWPVRRATLARFLRFGRPVWVEAQAVPIARQFDLAVVYALFGSAGAGVYDRAMRSPSCRPASSIR
jgi:hypothetical protein